MDTINEIFGEGSDLTTLQLSLRALVVFFIALILIRIAGRRTFGMHAAFDNIIVVLLGAMLGRAVQGASPFGPTVAACAIICFLHRIFAWIGVYSDRFEQLIEGKKILLYEDGKMVRQNLYRGLVSEEDVKGEVRRAALTESMDGIDKVYLERNGVISPVKKENKEK